MSRKVHNNNLMMCSVLKCNSLRSMISHQPQQQNIFHPCNKTCLGVNGLSSTRLLPQTCKQRPALCWPQSFKGIQTQTKTSLYCHSVSSFKCESFFSLQAMTVLAMPKSGSQGGMKVVSQCHRWYLSSQQAAGGASWPALLGPSPSWKPRASE